MTLHFLGLFLISLIYLTGCAQSSFTTLPSTDSSNNILGDSTEIHFEQRSDAQNEVVDNNEQLNSPKSTEDNEQNKSPIQQQVEPTTTPKVGSEKVEAPHQGVGQVLESGFIKPTIYYHAVLDEDKDKCSKSERLTSTSGNTLANVCKKTLAECKMEGSCAVVQNGVQRSFNISSKVNGIYRFFETTKDVCKFGYGVKQTCLDPFYSVAADLNIYHTGDVLFIPAIKGVQLPDGSKHSGYFVVRDSGSKIIGKGRFDFYSGFLHWTKKENPFKKLGLADIKTQIPYKIIGGTLAVAARNSRAFPKIP
jgi:3D (Asp-Asp-Asp) domain-containing protein